MTSETQSSIEDNNFIQVSECQGLDSFLQNSCETSNQSDGFDIGSSSDSKSISNSESCPKRSWSEIVDLYINSLKPIDTVIFIENVKVFSKGTVYMLDFRNCFDQILKYLNGGEPLKTDFGRDEYTSLYSLYSFSAVNSENKEECVDTPMIFKVMESMDILNFVERNPGKVSSNMKVVLKDAKDIFLYYNKIRNNHPKRKRYFILITCSDLLIDDIQDVVEELKSMKVRFSLFSPVSFESHLNLCELLNYNKKGCKDLSCFYQSTKWPVSLTHGLSKAFESTISCPTQGKKLKWNATKEQGETNEYDFNSFMSLGNVSNGSQVGENIQNHVPLDMDNSLNNSLTGRQLNTNEQLDQNFGQPNVNINNTLPASQSAVAHSKMQSKFMPTSNAAYYSQGSINQSQMNKINQSSYYYSQDQLYSAPNSVSVSSHRSTPSSIPHSQSPQFHIGSSHQNILQQSNSVPDMMKPNSVESCNELHNQITTQMNYQKSLPMNQEMEMAPTMQRLSYMNNMNNMYNASNTMMNSNTMNPARFVIRPSICTSTMDSRTVNIYEGLLVYGEDMRTDFRLFVDQSANLSILSMDSWERQCHFCYTNYTESMGPSLYGKTSNEIDQFGHDKTSVDLHMKISSDAHKTICSILASKPTIGFARPYRQISSEVHVQLICFLFNKTNLKVFIPADPKNLFNEIKNRLIHPGNQAGQIYPSMKRNNIVPNQQVYNIPPGMSIQRQIMNRYNSAPMAMMGNPVYRNISHSANFINNQQIQPNSNYILHTGQYPTVQNPPSNHMMSMDMGIQSNQNIYDQNSY